MLDASDAIAAGTATLGAGVVVGLGHVLFDVAAGAASGAVTIAIADGPATGLVDATGSAVGFVTRNGTLSITGSATAVPEPSALALLAAAALLGTLMRGRRQRRGS